jgi:hypothetical protein
LHRAIALVATYGGARKPKKSVLVSCVVARTVRGASLERPTPATGCWVALWYYSHLLLPPSFSSLGNGRQRSMVPVMRAPARILARVASLRCYGYVRSLSGPARTVGYGPRGRSAPCGRARGARLYTHCRRLRRGRARQRAQVLSHQRHDARFAHRGPAGTAPGTGSRKKRGYPWKKPKQNAQGLQNSKAGGRGPEGPARNG